MDLSFTFFVSGIFFPNRNVYIQDSGRRPVSGQCRTQSPQEPEVMYISLRF